MIIISTYSLFTGEFYQRPEETVVLRGERAEKVYHEDHIHFEGRLSQTTTSRTDFKGVRGERVDVRKHRDNLYMEGISCAMSLMF